jgi:hypothetical protein
MARRVRQPPPIFTAGPASRTAGTVHEGEVKPKPRTPRAPKPQTPKSGGGAKAAGKTPGKATAAAAARKAKALASDTPRAGGGAKAAKAAKAAAVAAAAAAAAAAAEAAARVSRHYPNAGNKAAGPEGYYWLPSFLVQEDMLGEALVGRRVRVWWVAERCFFEASVVAYDRDSVADGQGGPAMTPGGRRVHGRHRLVYMDDGVVMHEMLVPHKGDWQLLVDEAAESAGLRRKRASSIDSADGEFRALLGRASSEGAKHRKVAAEEEAAAAGEDGDDGGEESDEGAGEGGSVPVVRRRMMVKVEVEANTASAAAAEPPGAGAAGARASCS